MGFDGGRPQSPARFTELLLYRSGMADSWITFGFSAHRVETLETFEGVAARRDLVVIEEPPTVGFLSLVPDLRKLGSSNVPAS